MSDDIVYLEDFAPQDGQPVNDWTPVVAAALASFSTNLDQNGLSYGGTIIFTHRPGQASIAALSNGVYNFLTPAIPSAPELYGVEVNRNVVLQGVGSPGFNAYGRSQLRFAPGLGGIRINWNDWPVQGLGLKNAANTRVDSLTLIGQRGAKANGIFFNTYARISNCFVNAFSGDGIRTSATTSLVPVSSSSLSQVEYCDVNDCDGNGYSTEGADANSVQFINVHARGNGGWGIYEKSFIGCQYWGGQIAGNRTGGIWANHVGINLFSGVYVESGDKICIGESSLVIGGVLAQAILAGENLAPFPPRVVGSGGISQQNIKSGDGKAEIGLGAAYGDQTMILGLKDLSEASGAWPYRLKRQARGGLAFDFANNGVPTFWFLNSRCTVANGFPFDISDVPDLKFNGGIAMRMHVLGTPTVGMVVDDVGKAAPPATDLRPLGSRRRNNSGNAGEPEYWLKTIAGWVPKGSQ